MAATTAQAALVDLIREARATADPAKIRLIVRGLRAHFRHTLRRQVAARVSHPGYVDLVRGVEQDVWTHLAGCHAHWDTHPRAFRRRLLALGREKGEQTEEEFRAFEARRAALAPHIRALVEGLLPGADKPTLDALEASIWEQVWKTRQTGGPLAARAEETASEAAALAGLSIRHNEGDEEAFPELRERFMPFLHEVLRRLCPRPEDREEVEQETWLRVSQLELDPTRAPTLRAFLRRVALNAAYDHWRKSRRYVTETDLSSNEENAGRFPRLLGTVGQLPYAAFNEFLGFTYGGDLPPHQALAYGFKALLGMPPREIVARYADCPLRSLTAKFLEAYSGGLIPEDVVRRLCRPLVRAMDRPLSSVLQDANTRQTYGHLLARICGDTCLRDYATGELANDIAHWAYSVNRAWENECS